MFDRIWVNCPHCGTKNELQSKAHECVLAEYDLFEAPLVLQADIADNSPYKCGRCHAYYSVNMQSMLSVYKHSLK